MSVSIRCNTHEHDEHHQEHHDTTRSRSCMLYVTYTMLAIINWEEDDYCLLLILTELIKQNLVGFFDLFMTE